MAILIPIWKAPKTWVPVHTLKYSTVLIRVAPKYGTLILGNPRLGDGTRGRGGWTIACRSSSRGDSTEALASV